MTWFQRQRQDFIRAQLQTYGMIRRAEIAERFGVTIQVASADIQAFVASHPGAIDYDRSAKCYTYDAREALKGVDPDPERECPVSPLESGKHQVDTSMESGPNNCFFCEQAMSAPASAGKSGEINSGEPA